MLLRIDHVTRYRYDRPVRGVVQSHRLTPSRFDGQVVVDWRVTWSIRSSISAYPRSDRFRPPAPPHPPSAG